MFIFWFYFGIAMSILAALVGWRVSKKRERQSVETRLALLRPQIDRVKAHLAANGRPSAIVTALHSEGLGNLELITIFKEATGTSLVDLKAFGQWWNGHEITDAAAFDAWAAKVFPAQ